LNQPFGCKATFFTKKVKTRIAPALGKAGRFTLFF
jgi:hypothetical protein